jgi:hypothetical protein
MRSRISVLGEWLLRYENDVVSLQREHRRQEDTTVMPARQKVLHEWTTAALQSDLLRICQLEVDVSRLTRLSDRPIDACLSPTTFGTDRFRLGERIGWKAVLNVSK